MSNARSTKKRGKSKPRSLPKRIQNMASMDGGAPLLISIPEAAAKLRTSRPTVYKLIKLGKLAAVSLGRARRITVASLNALADPAA
jgi:excisionase family DNA binding protein